MGGCDFTAAIVTEGWRKCRDEFPVTEEQSQVMINIIYYTLVDIAAPPYLF